jgi:hypothetical protein
VRGSHYGLFKAGLKNLPREPEEKLRPVEHVHGRNSKQVPTECNSAQTWETVSALPSNFNIKEHKFWPTEGVLS